METIKQKKMISPGLYPKRFHQEKIFVQFRPQTDQSRSFRLQQLFLNQISTVNAIDAELKTGKV